METTIDEVSDSIYRISTYVPDADLTFNQVLVDADEPMLFHLGMRALFPLVSEAVAKVRPVDQLRWLSFGHVEADECGAMNGWLAAAPSATVAFGGLGCMVSVNDLADRAPRPLEDGEVLDLGGKRLRYLATPHVPHGWDAGIFFEETTSTLLCGDLFTQTGERSPTSTDSPLEATIAAEQVFGYTCAAPGTSETLERLAALEPSTLALMHGSTHQGTGGVWLRDLADVFRPSLVTG
ncbi:MAG: MBL fold metallo-hydrolase [Acidimicrobiia bacterium]|nr:MBL fold metallo-hydrolase [Acidimicrobiia bacterium]